MVLQGRSQDKTRFQSVAEIEELPAGRCLFPSPLAPVTSLSTCWRYSSNSASSYRDSSLRGLQTPGMRRPPALQVGTRHSCPQGTPTGRATPKGVAMPEGQYIATLEPPQSVLTATALAATMTHLLRAFSVTIRCGVGRRGDGGGSV